MALPLAAIFAAASQTAIQIARNNLTKQPLRSSTGVTGSGRAGAGLTTFTTPIASGVQSVIDNALRPASQTPLTQRILGGPTLSTIQALQQGVPTFNIPTGYRRKYRRMDVCNVKALRRAGRRIEGFVRLAKSLVAMPGARAKHPIKRARRRR